MKTNPAVDKNRRYDSPPDVDFHGASIINAEGEEIPITENMVQQACKSYIKQWEQAQKKRSDD